VPEGILVGPGAHGRLVLLEEHLDAAAHVDAVAEVGVIRLDPAVDDRDPDPPSGRSAPCPLLRQVLEAGR
jgi:hypothetical protein